GLQAVDGDDVVLVSVFESCRIRQQESDGPELRSLLCENCLVEIFGNADTRRERIETGRQHAARDDVERIAAEGPPAHLFFEFLPGAAVQGGGLRCDVGKIERAVVFLLRTGTVGGGAQMSAVVAASLVAGSKGGRVTVPHDGRVRYE